jgi:hypothetical protein
MNRPASKLRKTPLKPRVPATGENPTGALAPTEDALVKALARLMVERHILKRENPE